MDGFHNNGESDANLVASFGSSEKPGKRGADPLREEDPLHLRFVLAQSQGQGGEPV